MLGTVGARTHFSEPQELSYLKPSGANMPAPIALFAFNRPLHLTRTLVALAANELANQSDIFIFCDGPRNLQESSLCAEVVNVANNAKGFQSVTVQQQEHNKGLAPSIIEGVSQVLATHKQVIVLEDDLITSPYFLRYMNDGLTVYANNPKVASIHGWCFPHTVADPPQTFLLRGADCWGWATWERAWDVFEPDANKLLDELQKQSLINEFDLEGSYAYSSMLAQAAKGEISSWAIRWHASVFLADMYTLHPGQSLVHNIGLDNSGTHCSATHVFDTMLSKSCPALQEQPIAGNTIMQHAQKQMYLHASSHNQQKTEINSPWQGDYPDWESATAACGEGYSSDAIFERVEAAALAVKKGQALWERDSVLFYHEEYSWPLVAGLMTIAVQHKGSLHVLDFGGALGSTYQQNKRILQLIPDVSWHIVEQPHVVDCGKQKFTSKRCTFHETMKECFAQVPINVVLFSSVLQYMAEPYAVLQEALDMQPAAILIDRTSFLRGREKITVQHVPEEIYPAKYPCWWLNRNRVASMLANSYTCLPDYKSPVDPPGFYGFLAIKKETYAQAYTTEVL